MPKGKFKTRYAWTCGAIYARKTKQGTFRWYMDYRSADGERVQRLAPNAATPEDAMHALEAAVKDEFNKATGRGRGRPATFKELSAIYLRDYAKINKRSWKDDEYRLQALDGFFGDYAPDKITPQLIEQFRAQRLGSGDAKSTVNRYVALLKTVYSLAVEWGFATTNPAKKIKQFSEREFAKERILSPAEEAALLDACHDGLRPIVTAALNTGMRRGELLALQWQDVDLGRGGIRVVRSKSGKQRTVPVNQTLRTVLAALPSRGKGGAVFDAKNAQAKFEIARTRAGLDGIRFHDLRHTFATRLVDKGADIITIQSLLGHSTVVMTMRYTHARDDRATSAVGLLDPENPPEKAPGCYSGVTRKDGTPAGVLVNRGESVN